jgi:hypothetical protein
VDQEEAAESQEDVDATGDPAGEHVVADDQGDGQRAEAVDLGPAPGAQWSGDDGLGSLGRSEQG